MWRRLTRPLVCILFLLPCYNFKMHCFNIGLKKNNVTDLGFVPAPPKEKRGRFAVEVGVFIAGNMLGAVVGSLTSRDGKKISYSFQ